MANAKRNEWLQKMVNKNLLERTYITDKKTEKEASIPSD
jgi:hypothetical protein